MDYRALIEEAKIARKSSYCPYSHFAVGAALVLEDGRIIHGCNIENASFGATNCAERTAIFKAVSEGKKNFKAIAIVGGPVDEEAKEFCPPCGICRQVMMEFCDPKTFEIVLAQNDEIKTYTLEEILPEGFGPSNL